METKQINKLRKSGIPDDEQLSELLEKGLKAYVVEYETAFIVVAENEKEAQKLGQKALEDELRIPEDFMPQKLSHLPDDWNNDTFVYHNQKGDIKVSTSLYLPGGYLFKEEKPDPNQYKLFE